MCDKPNMNCYPFSTTTTEVGDKWRDVEHGRTIMDGHMQRLYDAIAKALDEDLFYKREIDQSVTGTLGEYFDHPNDPRLEEVDGGIRGMEIYYARKAVETHRRLTIDREAIKHISLNQKFRNFNYNSTNYSTALVVEMDRKNGWVRLLLTKQGSSNRWNVTIGASVLPEHKPMPAKTNHTMVSENVPNFQLSM